MLRDINRIIVYACAQMHINMSRSACAVAFSAHGVMYSEPVQTEGLLSCWIGHCCKHDTLCVSVFVCIAQKHDIWESPNLQRGYYCARPPLRESVLIKDYCAVKWDISMHIFIQRRNNCCVRKHVCSTMPMTLPHVPYIHETRHCAVNGDAAVWISVGEKEGVCVCVCVCVSVCVCSWMRCCHSDSHCV